MKLVNYDLVADHKLEKKKKGGRLDLPENMRARVCGPASCGKTNLVLNLVCNEGWLDYDRLYVYSKTLFQSKYELLKRAFEETCPGVATFCSANEDVLSPENLPMAGKSVVLFDDFMIEKQDAIERYFAYGRHAGADIFYLCQTYSRIPKRVVRDNANVLILFRQDDANLRHVYRNHVGGDVSFDEFRNKCAECWNSDPYGFLTLDKTKPSHGGRYRAMLD